MARHYHVINSETGQDYTESVDADGRETAGVPTLRQAQRALARAKREHAGDDVWILGSVAEGEIRVYVKRWQIAERRADLSDLGYDVMVSITIGGVSGVECVCDEG